MPSHSGVEHDLFEPPPPPDAYAQSNAAEAAAVDLSDAALSERPPRNDSAPPLFDLTHTGPTKAPAPQEDIDFLLGLQGSRGTTAALQNPTLADLAKKPPSEPPPLPIDVEIPVAEAEPEPEPTPAPAKRERTPPNAPSLAAVASQTAPPPRAPAIATPPPKPRKRSAALIAVAALGISGAVLASTMLTRQPGVEAPTPPTTDSPEPAAPARNARPGLPESAEATTPDEPPAPGESVAPPASRAPKAPSRTGVPNAKQLSAPSTLAPRSEPARPEPARVEPVRPPPVTPRPSAPRAPVGAGFDRQAAINALTTQASQASSCRKGEDPSGTATVVITFAPSGRVTSANVSGPPFAGTPTGGCIAAAFRRARVPEFDGDNVTVSKTVVIH